MTKTTKVPDKLKIKLVLEIDKELYDKIVAQAKVENLPGAIEDVLIKCCLAWFDGWQKIFDAKDNPEAVVPPPKLPSILGPDGQPMGRA